jgi:hypothetical protein
MAAYNAPDFNERAAAARAAKERALEKLKNKPVMDEATIAARQAAQAARDQVAAEKRAAKLLAQQEAKAARAEKAAAAEAAKPAPKVPLTPEEQKAARDARYAARKQRKG